MGNKKKLETSAEMSSEQRVENERGEKTLEVWLGESVPFTRV